MSNRDTKIATTPRLTFETQFILGAAYSRNEKWVCGVAVQWLYRRKSVLPDQTKIKLEISKQKLEGGRRVYIGFWPGDSHPHRLLYNPKWANWSYPRGCESSRMYGPLSRLIFKAFPGITQPERFYVRLVIVK